MRRDLIFLRGERRFLMCLRVWVTEKTIQGSIAQLDQSIWLLTRRSQVRSLLEPNGGGVYTERVRVSSPRFVAFPRV